MWDHKGQIFSQELQLITLPVIVNDFGICCMSNVCVLSRYPQPSSRDLLYVQCLCVLSRYPQPSSRDLVYPLLGYFVSEKKQYI